MVLGFIRMAVKHPIAGFVAYAIIFGTHIFMITNILQGNEGLPMVQQMGHAVLNMVAGGMLLARERL